MRIIDIVERILIIREEKIIVFVSICGAADTGKSTIARKICDELRLKNISCDFICTDSFMIDRRERIENGISGYNPRFLKEKELKEVAENIENREEVRYFIYDNRIGKNSGQYKIIKEIEILIIEGIHSFNDIIRGKIHLKIFINANDKTLRQLRYKANINKRGFSENEARKRIGNEMEEYHYFIQPNKKYSDIILTVAEGYSYE